jgi:hypothetical protein
MDRTPGGLVIPKGVSFAHLGDEDTGDVDWLVGIKPVDPSRIPPDEGDEQAERPPDLRVDEALEAHRVKHGAVSGLNADDRAKARELILRGLRPLLLHPGLVHYTQGPLRWGAIKHHIIPWDRHGHPTGDFLRESDCSGTNTWGLWLPLGWHFGLPDLVNGERWEAGFTGTMRQHGKIVVHESSWKVGDQIFYVGPDHVVTYTGGGFAFSHGSEAGPFKLDPHYRRIVEVRRYI